MQMRFSVHTNKRSHKAKRTFPANLRSNSEHKFSWVTAANSRRAGRTGLARAPSNSRRLRIPVRGAAVADLAPLLAPAQEMVPFDPMPDT